MTPRTRSPWGIALGTVAGAALVLGNAAFLTGDAGGSGAGLALAGDKSPPPPPRRGGDGGPKPPPKAPPEDTE